MIAFKGRASMPLPELIFGVVLVASDWCNSFAALFFFVGLMVASIASSRALESSKSENSANCVSD